LLLVVERLDELYEVIRRLMNATFEATGTEMKVRLAHLEYRARQYRQMIQDRLAIDMHLPEQETPCTG
jgi:hypothetical protein